MMKTNFGKPPDALKRSAFPVSDKLRRFLWMVAYRLLFRWTPIPLHGWRSWILRLFGADIGRDNFIYPDACIWAPWLLRTGAVVTLGPRCEIYNPGGISLGHHTIISQGSYLCGATHDYNSPDFSYVKKEIITGPYTWICARAIVLPGVLCGEGSVLGAGSVIASAMKPWTVYAGNPAKALKSRNPSIIANQPDHAEPK